MRSVPLLLAAALIMPALARPASAELGGPLSTVSADRARMGARLASVPGRGFTRHELARPNGGAVHEFTNAAGQVFAVSWSGPGKPDLRALLGRYFGRYQAAGSGFGRTMHALRRPIQVSEPDLTMASEGHMGFFRGVAFVRSMAPAGFSPDALTVAP